MDLGPHAFFIVASYGVTALVMAGLILRALIDHRAQRRALDALEARGMARRSEPGDGQRVRHGPMALTGQAR